MEAIYLLLAAVVCASALPQQTPCERAVAIARRSKCPSSQWKDALASALVANHSSSSSTSTPLVYVNAGANKGFAVAEFLQRFHDDAGRAVSNREWHRSIKVIKPSGMFGCGMCGACKEAPPPLAARRNVSVRVYAFELLKPNYLLLTKLFARHSVPGTAFHVAVSNYTGVAYAPTGVRTGQEWTSAEIGEQATANTPVVNRRSKSWAAVPSTTIDAFAAKEGLERIDWLSVDAEGWDPLILEGSSGLLKARRVDLLEFEYHSKGLWAEKLPVAERRDLKATLATLSASGYACFWQGDKGGLAEAGANRWCDGFEFRGHSNLVCSHREDVIGALRALDYTARPKGARVG